MILVIKMMNKPKILGIFFFVLASFLFAFPCFAAGERVALTTPEATIYLPVAVWDLGQVKQHESFSKVFKIENIGNAPLLIEKTRVSCGCTIAHLGTREVAPQESTELKMQFNTRKFVNEIKKYVYIHSNDPKRPVAKIIITADIANEKI